MIIVFTKKEILFDKFKNVDIQKSIVLFMEGFDVLNGYINCDIAIINSDYNFYGQEKINAKQVITYGYNPKSTITISSSVEDYVSCAVQREFLNAYNQKIDIGEIIINKNENKSIDAVAFEILNEIIKYKI